MLVPIKSCWKTFFTALIMARKNNLEENFTLICDWDSSWIKRFESKTKNIMKSIRMLQWNGFFFTKAEGLLGIFKNWLFWLHWNETCIPQMLSSVAINYSYYSCFQLQVISYKKHKIRDILLILRNHKFL